MQVALYRHLYGGDPFVAEVSKYTETSGMYVRVSDVVDAQFNVTESTDGELKAIQDQRKELAMKLAAINRRETELLTKMVPPMRKDIP
jgi:hypothetical protein